MTTQEDKDEKDIRADERARIVMALRQRTYAAERATWAQAADFIEREGARS